MKRKTTALGGGRGVKRKTTALGGWPQSLERRRRIMAPSDRG